MAQHMERVAGNCTVVKRAPLPSHHPTFCWKARAAASISLICGAASVHRGMGKRET